MRFRIKHLFLISIMVLSLIMGSSAYQQDFQYYDGTGITITNLDGLGSSTATYVLHPYSETRELHIYGTPPPVGEVVMDYALPQAATNWSVVISGGNAMYYRFLDAAGANIAAGIDAGPADTNPYRYDFSYNADADILFVYRENAIVATNAGLGGYPYYFMVGLNVAAANYNWFDDYTISPIPSADPATRNHIETLPADYYVRIDSIAPANNGLYNTSTGLIRGLYYYNRISTISNASKIVEVYNTETGAVYDHLATARCTNTTQWNISVLTAAGAPTGSYRFRWIEEGYGSHLSDLFWVTSGAATVTWDKTEYNLEEDALITWNIDAGWYDTATYDYTLDVQDIYGSVIYTQTIGQVGTTSINIAEDEYEGGQIYYAVVRATTKTTGTVYVLGASGMTVSDTLSISGYVMDAVTGWTIWNANVTVNQSGSTYYGKTTTAGDYNVTGPIPDFALQINTSYLTQYYLNDTHTWTPLISKSYTINISLQPIPNGSNIYDIGGVVYEQPYYQPVVGAEVNAENLTYGYHASVTTNIAGFYGLNNLVPNIWYHVNATMVGYAMSVDPVQSGWVKVHAM